MPQGAGCPFQLQRLKTDGALRTEVDYCAEKGIPHSEFLLRWDNEDRAKLVASLILKGQRCTMCGTSKHEWFEDPGAYVAMWEECMGCLHKDALREAEGHLKKAGSSVVLKSREEHERLTLNPAAEQGRPRLSRRERKPRDKG